MSEIVREVQKSDAALVILGTEYIVTAGNVDLFSHFTVCPRSLVQLCIHS